MFHIELRQFPHNVNRFNLDQAGLWAVLEPWVRDQAVELGDRRWSPLQTTIKVIEGPEIPLDQLTMGRGWRAAEREGEDVTDYVLAQAREAVASASPGTTAQAAGMAHAPAAAVQTPAASSPGGLAAGVELAGLLGADAVRLLAAWSEIAARAPALAPSESLALAERSLAESDAPPAAGETGGG
jgi:hypothetical protein